MTGPENGRLFAAADIAGLLGPLAARIPLEVTPVCASTNLLVRQRAADLPDWYTLVACRQTEGRGQQGRSFYSPPDTGLYMSVLLRPKLPAEQAVYITTAAAVAVCRAAEELGAERAQIKWVNDVLIRERKVCGILTQGGAGPAGMDHVVLGRGINVTEPAGGFPPPLSDIAGAVFPAGGPDRRPAMAAAVMRQLWQVCEGLAQGRFIPEYRRRSCLVGRQVQVEQNGQSRPALALGVDERCRLVVRWPDGQTQALLSGRVQVCPQNAPGA